jgi:histidinol dehydrogenase
METLRIVKPSDVQSLQLDPVNPKAREQAAAIIAEVREKGSAGLVEVAHRLRDIESPTAKIYYTREDLKQAYDSLDVSIQQVLSNTATRISSFAAAQRQSITDVTTTIPGGRAGHTIAPVDCAGCYAPGGRYPLPSSVLMTAITARVAGVRTVYVASPRPALATLAAAHVAEADGLLAIGGAQAIAAMAWGIEPVQRACDVIVGPGNQWVTAAKSLVSGLCAIDMLAGPSEVLVIADEKSNADTIAADLLAQAEHDTEARPILVSPSLSKIEEVNQRLQARLAILPTADTARFAVQKGFAVLVDNMEEAIQISDLIGPEHLEIHTENPATIARQCSHYGAVFIGEGSAEVLGDYGAGPNHVLPTCGTARYTGGLSVFTFLRIRTWMEIDNLATAQDLVRDCVALARVEGLEGHARSAECRLLENRNNTTTANTTTATNSNESS